MEWAQAWPDAVGSWEYCRDGIGQHLIIRPNVGGGGTEKHREFRSISPRHLIFSSSFLLVFAP